MRKVRAPKGAVQDNILALHYLVQGRKVQQKGCTGRLETTHAVVKSGKPYGVQDQVSPIFRLTRLIPSETGEVGWVGRLTPAVMPGLEKWSSSAAYTGGYRTRLTDRPSHCFFHSPLEAIR